MTPFCALIDWGTSSFRLWLVDRQGTVLAESRSDEGMMHSSQAGFASVLENHLGKLGARADLPVVISGMAGARQGWVEAPYVDIPAPLDGLAVMAVRVPHEPRDVRILPGMAQNRADAANVMRGEETQLAGIAATHPDGLVCMPGTHCKWVSLEGGHVTGISSFMTGEVFAVLGQHSILQHALEPQARFDADHPTFRAAAGRALARPSQAMAMLFPIRASQLLGFERREDGAPHLSGVLIGAEIAAARELYGAGRAGLVASQRLNALYKPIMEEAGFSVDLIDGEEAVRAGLLAAARQLHPVSGE
ncbi:2-dehydro-3-deoxygalactonokinase [Aquamicrobium terrae]